MHVEERAGREIKQIKENNFSFFVVSNALRFYLHTVRMPRKLLTIFLLLLSFLMPLSVRADPVAASSTIQ